jgi:hypothetical protein
MLLPIHRWVALTAADRPGPANRSTQVGRQGADPDRAGVGPVRRRLCLSRGGSRAEFAYRREPDQSDCREPRPRAWVAPEPANVAPDTRHGVRSSTAM